MRSMTIVLIHGTFSPEASWTQPTSELRRALQRQMGADAHLESFPWSGKNTAVERYAGAQDLMEHLRSVTVDYPGTPIAIIAHSHGGNVTLRALTQLPI